MRLAPRRPAKVARYFHERHVTYAAARSFIVATAVLDRLLHHCTVVSIEGESYRMRGHRERLGQLREAVAGGGEFR